MTTTTVNTPCEATLVFVPEEGVTIDHATLTIFGPDTPPEVVPSTDSRVSLPAANTYAITFWPTTFGKWWATGIGYDSQDRPVAAAAASIDVGAPPYFPDVDDAHRLAVAVVEEHLHRPVGLVEKEVGTFYVDADEVLRLPFRPVVKVWSVVPVSGSPSFAWTLRGSVILGLPAYTWATVTYDHGWADGSLPNIISLIIDAVAARVDENPTGIQREQIGAYSVGYSPSTDYLTRQEKQLLTRYQCLSDRAGTIDMRPPRRSNLPSLAAQDPEFENWEVV